MPLIAARGAPDDRHDHPKVVRADGSASEVAMPRQGALPHAALALVAALAAGSAAAETREFQMVGCPEGFVPQWRSIDLEDAIAPYHARAGDVPAPPVKPRQPRFARAARHDPDFPRSGKVYAILLVSERGRVENVLVHCATSAKLAAPMIEAWRGARVGVATRDGKPVRTAFVAGAGF